ncbi:hypothetical protein P4283_15545 [Bacillus thuringiensis]|nr:hypothetical protein [Bacillus thuringiensis]
MQITIDLNIVRNVGERAGLILGYVQRMENESEPSRMRLVDLSACVTNKTFCKCLDQQLQKLYGN